MLQLVHALEVGGLLFYSSRVRPYRGDLFPTSRAGLNARGSLARSVHGQLGSARIGSFESFQKLS
jgi:hypothetical protein